MASDVGRNKPAPAGVSGEVSRRQVASRLAGTIGLFLFAMSFMHFGAGESSPLWPIELLSHHDGLPLALFVLLQDYRSVLVDAMIRFLANILLAAVFVAGVAVLHDKMPPLHYAMCGCEDLPGYPQRWGGK